MSSCLITVDHGSEWYKGQAEILLYLLGVAGKTQGAEVWRALFAEQLQTVTKQLERQ